MHTYVSNISIPFIPMGFGGGVGWGEGLSSSHRGTGMCLCCVCTAGRAEGGLFGGKADHSIILVLTEHRILRTTTSFKT